MNDLNKKVDAITNMQKEGGGGPGSDAKLSSTKQRDASEQILSKGKAFTQKGRQTQANFMNETREQNFKRFIKNQTRGPPVGAYRTRFGTQDPDVRAPMYGTQTTWGGALSKKAEKIREANFREKVHKCRRLDKTLVYKREMKEENTLNYLNKPSRLVARNPAFSTQPGTITNSNTDSIIHSKRSNAPQSSYIPFTSRDQTYNPRQKFADSMVLK